MRNYDSEKKEEAMHVSFPPTCFSSNENGHFLVLHPLPQQAGRRDVS